MPVVVGYCVRCEAKSVMEIGDDGELLGCEACGYVREMEVTDADPRDCA